ncbi:hypothetical protein ABZ912_58775 [Nonomuraea angiospora]|uniref:hypothetical protein n=1 Tax=Nonomuraea angiospora TaxID=46172 RepID=UPI00340C4224
MASLLEWRRWIEELSEHFAELTPPVHLSAEDRSWHLDRATVRLVTRVVDRTGAESGWYRHCHQVLEWFLASSGLEKDEAEAAVQVAIGGRFNSWFEPARTVVDAVGEDLASGLTGHRPYRDH